MDFKKIVDRLLYTNLGQIFISLILGLSLSLIFKRVCKENCVIYVAPNNSEIENKLFKLEDTCYKYTTTQVKCNEKDANSTIQYYDGYDKADNQIEEPSFLSKVFS